MIGEEGRSPAAGPARRSAASRTAVLLDLHQRDVATRVREASPDTVVVLWARDEEVMEVLGTEARRIECPTPEDLGQVLAGARSIGSP